MEVDKSQVNEEQVKREERAKKPCDNTSPEVVAPKIPSLVTRQKELNKEKLDYTDTSSLMDILDFTLPFAKTCSGDGDPAPPALPQAPSPEAWPPSTKASTSLRPPSTEASASLLLPGPRSTKASFSGGDSVEAPGCDEILTHMLNLEAERRDGHPKLLGYNLIPQFDESKRFSPCWQVMEDSSIATPSVAAEIYHHCIPPKDLVEFIYKDPCTLSDIFSAGFLQAGAAFRAAQLQNLYWRNLYENGTAECPLLEAPSEQFQSQIKLYETGQKLKLVAQELEEAIKALKEEKTREEESVKACEEARRKGRIEGEKEVHEKFIRDFKASNSFNMIIERRASIIALKFIIKLLPHECDNEYKNELVKLVEELEKFEVESIGDEFEFDQVVKSMYDNESV